MASRKYETIRNELYRRLCDGEYPVGARLPTDAALAESFSVHRHTVSRAVSFLSDSGLVRRAPRLGTIVVERPASAGRTGTVKVLYRRMGEDRGDSPDYRAAARIVERFTRLFPHIEVELVAEGRDKGFNAPAWPAFTDRAGVMVSRFSYVADYARHDLLMPLDDFDDFADVSGPLDERLVYRTADSSGKRRIHALPVQMSSWMLAANVGLLRSLGLEMPRDPATWAELLALCETAARRGADRGIRPVCIEIMGGRQLLTRFFPYFYSANGGTLLMDPVSGQPQLNTPGNEAFLVFLRQLYARGLCHPDGSHVSFLNGQSLFRLGVIQVSIDEARRHEFAREVEAVPIPLPSAGAAPCTVLRGEFVGILGRPRHTKDERRAAWEFVKFLVSPEAQEIAFREAGHLPARPDLMPMVSDAGGLARRFFEYGLRHGLPTFDLPRNADIHSVLQQVMVRTMTGVCEPAEALAEGQDMLKAYVVSRADAANVRRDPALVM